MNKTAIKNFAIWARNKLIADITYKAGLLGITEKEIKNPLPQSTQTVQFFDIGTKEPNSITSTEIEQRKKLVEEIQRKASQGDYSTAYKNVIEEVAYTWFNRLIAIRFMEVNDYLPTRVRVLSSESRGKSEPDIVTHALDVDLNYSAFEKDRIMQLKHENKLNELFRMLFIKQCNALNVNLPDLFEKTSDYTELLLNVSFTDKDGVVYHLVNDISEDDFNVSKEGQVEIIGWLYQYYNTEPKDETFALLKKNVKITKERIPAATQLFTPDWIVRYMVENSLGRLWMEGHPNDELKSNWKYYLDEAEQDEDVKKQLESIREEYKTIKPEEIKVIDPAMGSGHILVYAFDVLMQIYESCGYSQRDAAKSIVDNNLYGLDIDNRAYQLAYFAVMMKARQYNRRILNGQTTCHIYSIQESSTVNRNQLKYFGAGLSELEKNDAMNQITGLLDTFVDAKEYGSILKVEPCNWELVSRFVEITSEDGQMSLDSIGLELTKQQLKLLLRIGQSMAQKYDVVVTNPPYLGSKGMGAKLSNYVQKNYPDSKADLFAIFIERCGQMAKETGYQAMITQHVWMYKTTYTKFREKLLRWQLINMAHLGANAFDEIQGEIVQTTAFVLMPQTISNYTSTFLRLIQYDTEREKERMFVDIRNQYYIKQSQFAFVAEYIYAYWISSRVLNILATSPMLETVAAPRKGLTTGDNERFVRLWFEVAADKFSVFSSEAKWFPMTKGGNFRKWYGNNEYIINWEHNGSELRNFKDENGKLRSVLRNTRYYFHESISWNDTASTDIAFRYQSDQYISNASGPCVYSGSIDTQYLMGMFNSKVSKAFLEVIAPALKFEVGQVGRFPVIYDPGQESSINEYVKTCIHLSKQDWDSFETSWNFIQHPLIRSVSTVSEACSIWETECNNRFIQLKDKEEELNRIFIGIYGLQNELTSEVEDKDVTVHRIFDSREDVMSRMKGSKFILTKQDLIKGFISYAVGCMFGRYSLDVDGLAFAGGDWDSSKYNTFIPDKDNILPITDEEYFKDDIVGLFAAFVKKVYGEENLEENLDFIAEALGNKGNSSRETIRNYFLKDFFKDHCSTYSVTGSGKRPIYWLFDSGKQNGFKALIYMHRYDENTIGNLRIDYLHKMQRIYENEITRMQETIENSNNAREVTAATKRKEKLTKQLKETKEYDVKIAHLALARTPIDLDDGVKVNYEKVQTDTEGKKLDVLAKI